MFWDMTIRDISYMGEGLIPAPLDGPAKRYTPLPKGAVTDIAIHHWTGWTPPETWTAGEEMAYIRRIDGYHRAGRGLDGIGYHLCPFPSGRIYITSRPDRYGAGVGGHNNHTLHIGLPGSFHASPPSLQHLAATVEAVRAGYDYLGRVVPTTPHLAWGGTTCPGARWREWVPQLQELAAQTLEEDEMFLVRAMPSGRTFVVGLGKIHLPPLAVRVYIRAGVPPPGDAPDAEVDAIPDAAIR